MLSHRLPCESVFPDFFGHRGLQCLPGASTVAVFRAVRLLAATAKLVECERRLHDVFGLWQVCTQPVLVGGVASVAATDRERAGRRVLGHEGAVCHGSFVRDGYHSGRVMAHARACDRPWHMTLCMHVF